jgi:hypothetical protein
MTRTIIAAAIALALSGCGGNDQVATAYTGSDAYPNPVTRPLYAQEVLSAGNASGPIFGPGKTQVIAGDSGLLPENGSDGIVQSANAVPASTIYGTTAFANAAHGRTAQQIAGGATKPRG